MPEFRHRDGHPCSVTGHGVDIYRFRFATFRGKNTFVGEPVGGSVFNYMHAYGFAFGTYTVVVTIKSLDSLLLCFSRCF